MVAAAPTSLRRAIRGLLFGNLAYLGSQFLMFTSLAHLTSSAEVGRFAWALALASPVFILADMRTQQLQVTDHAMRFSFGDYLIQRMATTVAAWAVLTVAAIALTSDPSSRATLAAVLLMKGLEGVLNTALGDHMRRERMNHVSRIQWLRSLVTLGSFASLAALTHRADGAVAAAGISLLIPIGLAFYGIPSKRVRSTIAWSRVWRLSLTALPLGLAFFVGSLTVNAPRFLIERYEGLGSLAVFSAVAYVVVLANTVVDTLTQATMPRISHLWNAGSLVAVKGLVRRMMAIGATIGVAGIAASAVMGGSALALLYGDEYRSGKQILLALMTAACMQYMASILRAAVIACGVRKGVLAISLVNFGIVLACAFITIPSHGALGGAWSLAAGQAFALGAFAVRFRGLWRSRPTRTSSGTEFA